MAEATQLSEPAIIASENRKLLDNAIQEICALNFTSLQQALTVVRDEHGGRVKLSNGLQYGYSSDYGGFALFKSNEDSEPLALVCPISGMSPC